MKNKLVLAILFVLLLGSASVQAQNPLKIGYMTVDYVLSQMPESKQIESELKTHRTQLETQLQAKYKDYQAKASDLEKNNATMTPVILEDKQKELANLQNSIEEFQRKAEQSLQEKQQKLLAPVLDKIQKAIKEVATENGFTYVFNSDAGAGTTPILLHAPDEGNVNDLVLKKMGVTPAPAGAAPAANKATTPGSTAPKATTPAPKKK